MLYAVLNPLSIAAVLALAIAAPICWHRQRKSEAPTRQDVSFADYCPGLFESANIHRLDAYRQRRAG